MFMRMLGGDCTVRIAGLLAALSGQPTEQSAPSVRGWLANEVTREQAVPIAVTVGVSMFVGWMIGYVRGHKAGLRDRAARFRK